MQLDTFYEYFHGITAETRKIMRVVLRNGSEFKMAVKSWHIERDDDRVTSLTWEPSDYPSGHQADIPFLDLSQIAVVAVEDDEHEYEPLCRNTPKEGKQ